MRTVIDTIYAAFEYAKYGDLRSFMRKNSVAGWAQCRSLNLYLRVARDIATALTQLSRSGVGIDAHTSWHIVKYNHQVLTCKH